jgi:hypothetical protein
MGKYDKFATFLTASGKPEIRLTFSRIEEILGFPLPASKAYQAWWSNNPWNNVMTKVWLEAGYKTSQVDIASETLVFVRDGAKPASGAPAVQFTGLPRSPLFGAMKGTSIITPGVDLTEPADPDWGKVYDDDYVPPGAELVVGDQTLSISDKIRELNDMGIARAQIAKLLGKRYQHVRNVLMADARKAG